MPRTPFSRPDVNQVVRNFYNRIERSRLNRWVRETLSQSRVKYLLVILVITLLLFGSFLIAWGAGGNPHTSTASSSSQTTSPSSISSSATTSTAASTGGSGPGPASTTGPTGHPTGGATTTSTGEPTTTPIGRPTITPTAGPTITPTAGPTVTPTAVPTPDPGSFTVSQQGVSFSGVAGLSDPATQQILLTYTAPGPLTWSVSVSTTDGANWLSVNPSSDTMSPAKSTENITITASNLKANLSPGSYTGTLTFSPVNPNHDNTVSVSLIVGPGIFNINPSNGPAVGGTSVIISGFGFTGATGVSFGSVAVSHFTIDSDTQITAVSPAGSGTVHITVTNPGFASPSTTADQFTYNASPVVSSISPTSGPATGGTNVIITGTGFTGATNVSFGSTVASFTFDSDTQITAVSPTGSGTVDVTVTTPNGTSATGTADQFTYT